MCFYFFAREKSKSLVVFFGSVLFYAVGCKDKPAYILILLLSLLVNYCCGLVIGRVRHKKPFMLLGFIFNFIPLFYFKYYGAVSVFVNGLLSKYAIPLQLPALSGGLEMPLGISFYTFHALSYLFDIYRSKIPAEKNIIKFGAYFTFFPKIISGPITDYGYFNKNFGRAKVTKEKFQTGAENFIFGLALKVVLSSRLSAVFLECQKIGFDSLSPIMAIMGIIAYSFRLYFDFYGYSLMAMGIAELMGGNLPQNFRYPYMAVSMTDFWRRWHITLGAFFRNYVYIPLGGNRRGKIRMIFNLALVFFLTGVWHGAGLNFLLWGAFLAVIVVIEKLTYGRFLEKHEAIGHIYMLFLIPFSWLLFALDSLSDIKSYLLCIIGRGSEFTAALDYLPVLKQYWPFLLLGLILSTPILRNIYSFFLKNKWYLSLPVLLSLLVYSGYCIYMGAGDPFMYFSF